MEQKASQNNHEELPCGLSNADKRSHQAFSMLQSGEIDMHD
jgi:hypothetical protein